MPKKINNKWKIVIYNSATDKVVQNKNTQTLREVFDFARKHIVSTNKKAHLTTINTENSTIIRIKHSDLLFGNDILIDQVMAKINKNGKNNMKPYKLRVCAVCNKKKKEGHFGAVVVKHISLARKRLKIKGGEIGVNEFLCKTCQNLVKGMSNEIIEKHKKADKKIKTKKGTKRKVVSSNKKGE